MTTIQHDLKTIPIKMTYNFYYFYSPICLLWLLFVGPSLAFADSMGRTDDDYIPDIVSAGTSDKTDTGDSIPTPITAGTPGKTDTSEITDKIDMSETPVLTHFETSDRSTKIDSADTFALLENNSARFKYYSHHNDL
jgi:hypothetical protein